MLAMFRPLLSLFPAKNLDGFEMILDANAQDRTRLFVHQHRAIGQAIIAGEGERGGRVEVVEWRRSESKRGEERQGRESRSRRNGRRRRNSRRGGEGTKAGKFTKLRILQMRQYFITSFKI